MRRETSGVRGNVIAKACRQVHAAIFFVDCSDTAHEAHLDWSDYLLYARLPLRRFTLFFLCVSAEPATLLTLRDGLERRSCAASVPTRSDVCSHFIERLVLQGECLTIAGEETTKICLERSCKRNGWPYNALLRILISAGEASGEMYGAQLIEALQRAAARQAAELRSAGQPGAAVPTQASYSTQASLPEFFGVGGERMRAAGCDTVVDAKDLSVVGITEILSHLPKIYGLY